MSLERQDERARRTLGLYQELESLVNGDRVRGMASASRLRRA